MSIFGNIMNKIFHHKSAAQQQPQPELTGAQAAPGTPTPNPAPGQSAATAAQKVDVGAVLSEMAATKGGGGNYQTSIVDLLKLLDLDSSLDARKQLANELNVHAGADGSAEENIALHKAVMQKLGTVCVMIPIHVLRYRFVG